jgi:hypothetical protein
MKIAMWSFLALLLTACTIGGLLSAAQGHDAPGVIHDLAVSALFSRGAWLSWKKASRPRPPGIARIKEPRERPWRRR